MLPKEYCSVPSTSALNAIRMPQELESVELFHFSAICTLLLLLHMLANHYLSSLSFSLFPARLAQSSVVFSFSQNRHKISSCVLESLELWSC